MRLPKGLKIVSIKDITIVRLYQTDIVTKTGLKMILENGGWYTSHTKKCMNLVLRQHEFNVFQKDNKWYVSYPDGKIEAYHNGMTIEVSQ